MAAGKSRRTSELVGFAVGRELAAKGSRGCSAPVIPDQGFVARRRTAPSNHERAVSVIAFADDEVAVFRSERSGVSFRDAAGQRQRKAAALARKD